MEFASKFALAAAASLVVLFAISLPEEDEQGQRTHTKKSRGDSEDAQEEQNQEEQSSHVILDTSAPDFDLDREVSPLMRGSSPPRLMEEEDSVSSTHVHTREESPSRLHDSVNRYTQLSRRGSFHLSDPRDLMVSFSTARNSSPLIPQHKKNEKFTVSHAEYIEIDHLQHTNTNTLEGLSQQQQELASHIKTLVEQISNYESHIQQEYLFLQRNEKALQFEIKKNYLMNRDCKILEHGIDSARSKVK